MSLKKERITSRDVAKVAGVSYNTVSLVMRDSPLVLPETKARVRAVIEQMGYQPNAAAAALRSSRSMTLGYLISREPEAELDDEIDVFRTRIFTAIADCAVKHDYYVLQSSFIDAQRSLSLLQSGRIDGLLVDTLIPQEIVQTLIENQAPIVVVGREYTDLPVSWVKADERSGVYQAIDHLIHLKHRRFGLITIDGRNHPIVSEREQGFFQALSDADIPFDTSNQAYGDWTHESGYRQSCVLLQRDPRPTALFVMNELMAVGALKAAHELGLRVPRDVAIVTSGASSWVNYTRPQLTSVNVPMYEVGRIATEVLLSMLNAPGTASPSPQHIVVPTQLIVRESSTRHRPRTEATQKHE